MLCAACGEENPERARFCSQCAAPLGVATSPTREERKVVTVLFCDLVGFTSRSEGMDVEDVRGTLQPYHRLLRRELESFGGTVEKFIGDAVMALFGAPVAHEDDAERAVRAALAIVEEVAMLRESEARLDLHVRIGVNTGEALISLGADPVRGEGMASGDVVNTAARLQAAAPVDGVLVGAATRTATSRSIRYREGEAVDAKGKSAPVPVWIVEGARAIVGEDETDATLALVGRGQERGLLLGALERARSEGSVQLVTLVGPPGIGKSRLIAELYQQIESEQALTCWRRGRSLAYGEGVALWALGEIVKAEAGILESDPPDVTMDKLREAVAALIDDAHDAEWVERMLRPLVGLEVEASADEGGRGQAFAAWRQFCEAIAEHTPAVFVFEDLHWADDALLEFIDHLAERAGDVPLLLVCTARPELLERRPAWGGGKSNALTVSLSPLSDADTARLIGELLEQALLPADTQAALLERAEGNPLYALEYVRMLRDEGALEQTASGWRLVENAARGEPPASVRGIIAARLDGLSESEKLLLQDAAVLGRTAWVGAAAYVGDISAVEVDEFVHQLARKQLVRRARHSSVSGDEEFSFTHALTQEVAYGQIPRPDRANKHLRVAEWIERLAGERDDKAELLAHHYHRALDLRDQVGANTADIAARARKAYTDAGRQAAAAHANSAAARHFTAALELTSTGDPTRPAVLLDRATALRRASEADEQTLWETLAAQVEPEATAWAEFLLAEWYARVVGDGDRADRHLARAAALTQQLPMSVRIGSVERTRVFRAYTQGMVAEATAIAARAIERAERAGLDEVQGMLMTWQGNVRFENGDITGLVEMNRAVEILARYANPNVPASYANIAEMERGVGNLARAGDLYVEALRWAERFGDPYQVVFTRVERASLAYHAGRWDDALAAVTPHVDDSAAANLLAARVIRGWILLGRGNGDQALQDGDAMIDYGTTARNSEMLFYGFALRAAASLEASDDSSARVDCDAFLAEWHRVGGMLGRYENLAEIAPVLMAHGRHSDLESAARLVKVPSLWADALVALAERRHADAAQIYHEIGTLPNVAATHLLGAVDAQAHGNASSAQAHVDAAVEFYRSVGATAYLRRAAALGPRAAEM